MDEFRTSLKIKILENIVFIVVVVMGLIYFVITNELFYFKVSVAILTLMYPWGRSIYAMLSVMFDWSMWHLNKKYILMWLSVAFLGALLLFSIGWKIEVYVVVGVSTGIGLVVFIVEKIFTFDRK